MRSHTHKFTIADEDAVHVLLNKVLDHSARQQRREKLLRAVKDASRGYETSTARERKAFFHGLLTGYAVALKLW
jgi:hypothetical protein